MKAFSNETSTRWRKFTEENARVENHPRIRHFDAHNHRIDQIIRPFQINVTSQLQENGPNISKVYISCFKKIY